MGDFQRPGPLNINNDQLSIPAKIKKAKPKIIHPSVSYAAAISTVTLTFRGKIDLKPAPTFTLFATPPGGVSNHCESRGLARRRKPRSSRLGGRCGDLI